MRTSVWHCTMGKQYTIDNAQAIKGLKEQW
jgi:hypothetical protein